MIFEKKWIIILRMLKGQFSYGKWRNEKETQNNHALFLPGIREGREKLKQSFKILLLLYPTTIE